jgi:hypothetical protein
VRRSDMSTEFPPLVEGGMLVPGEGDCPAKLKGDFDAGLLVYAVARTEWMLEMRRLNEIIVRERNGIEAAKWLAKIEVANEAHQKWDDWWEALGEKGGG